MLAQYTRIKYGLAGTALAVALCVLVMLLVTPGALAAPYGGYAFKGKKVDSGRILTTDGVVYAVSNYQLMYDPYAEEEYIYTVQPYAFITVKGMSYNKAKNTLTLKNVKAPKDVLRVLGMGSDFKIKLKGKNALGGIEACTIEKKNGKPAATSITFTGKGSLTVNKKKVSDYAIDVDGGGRWTYGSAQYSDNPERDSFLGGTASAVTVKKTATLKLYASKKGSPIRVSGTTMNSSTRAIVIKGKAKQSTKSTTKKYAAWKEYKHAQLVDVAKSKNVVEDTVYLIDGNNYIVDEDDGYDATMCKAVNLGGGIYAPNYMSSEYIVNYKNKATKKLTAKIITRSPKLVRDDISEVIALNNGKYYAVPAPGATKAKRSKGAALRWYSDEINGYEPALGWWNKWTVYKAVKSSAGKVYVKKLKDVNANGDVPKGYTGTKLRSYKATYTYKIKSSKLVISPK